MIAFWTGSDGEYNAKPCPMQYVEAVVFMLMVKSDVNFRHKCPTAVVSSVQSILLMDPEFPP